MKMDFTLQVENFWSQRSEFLEINPTGEVPVLFELNGMILPDSHVISEYLNEAYINQSFLGEDLAQKSETRRLVMWFDCKFSRDVVLPILYEKVIKRFLSMREGPDSQIIRRSKFYIHEHLEYISFLIDRRRWLSGDHFSLADISAAAHLSVIDYLGDVPWDKHDVAKDWYARIKSRPAFRQFLHDRISGILPSPHYGDLDF